MKFKNQNRWKTSQVDAKNIDDDNEEDIPTWAGSSFTSVASSVTAPPSQTASFYKTVLKRDFGDDDDDWDGNSSSDVSLSSESLNGDDDDDDDDDNTMTWRSSQDEDNLSFADQSIRSSDDGTALVSVSSTDAAAAKKKSQAMKKKKRGGLFRRSRSSKNKSNKEDTIQEGEDEGDEDDEISRRRRPRRLSLFGNSTHSKSTSTDGSFSVDDHHSQVSSQDGGGGGGGSVSQRTSEDNGAPVVQRTGKAKRRGSLGGLFSSKPKSEGDTANDLGYEDAAPSIATSQQHQEQQPRQGRRGSIGSMFSRRGSVGSIATSQQQHPSNDGTTPAGRRRRNSLIGSSSEHIPSSMTGITDALSGTSLHTSATNTKAARTGRRASLTNSGSSSRNSKSSDSFTKVKIQDRDMYWMINQERKARKMKPFRKSILLETLAQSMANELSLGKPPTPTEYYGNIGCGKSLEQVHQTIMGDFKGISRKNIINESFTEFGFAETIGPDRQIYTVTLFH